MLADAVVVEQPVAVTELDALGDEIHVQKSITRRPLLGRARQRRPARRRAATRGCRGARDLRQRRARVGSRGARDGRAAARARRRSRATSSRSWRCSSTCATCSRRRTGRCAASRPAFDTPDEDVYLDGRNVDPAVEGGRLLARADGMRDRDAARHARRQPVSRRDAGVLRRHGARAVARARRRRSRSRRRSRRCTRRTSFAAGIELGVPLELTLSCMQPKDGLHCGSAASAASGAMRSGRRGSRTRRRTATAPDQAERRPISATC